MKDISWKSLFGALKLDESADDFVENLKRDRTFSRKSIDLWKNIFVVSEITIAELKYGVEKSTHKERNRKTLETFQANFDIIPIFTALYIYAKKKARLKTKGKILDDFDLLIGCTATFNNLTLVTKNVNDFDRLEEIYIGD